MSDFRQGKDDANGSLPTIIQQTGLPDTIKGRAQQFLMRWLAGSIAHPYFQAVRENLDTIEGRSRVNMMLAEEVGRQAIADPFQVERAKARFLGDLNRKQENVEAIGAATAAKVEEQVETDNEAATVKEPSTDFMNAFTRVAEDASSDELRDRLASILAGEIKRPGTFSRATLRLAAEIEQDDLLGFQEALKNRVGDRIYAPDDWAQGSKFMLGLRLMELGLVSGAGGTSHNFTWDSRKNAFMIGQKHGLVVTAKTTDSPLTVGVWIISKAGLELASLLPEGDEASVLKQVAADINKMNIEQIMLGRTRPIGGGMVNVSRDEVLYLDPSNLSHAPLPPGRVTASPTSAPPRSYKLS